MFTFCNKNSQKTLHGCRHSEKNAIFGVAIKRGEGRKNGEDLKQKNR